MSNPSTPESHPVAETNESFEDILTQYEKSHSRKKEDDGKQLEGTVIAVSAESVFFDIGFKTEGIMPLTVFQNAGESVKPGDKISVSVKGRDPEGYYELSRQKIARPTDWSSLEQAFIDKATVVGTVTGVIKGGFSVDIGVRAFMPASRSGVRDAADMEKLVGQEVRCRIIKLDATEEDVVVDRRALAEEEERSTKERRYSEIREGEVVHGTVRSLTDYGAFIDLGGVDGLLHVGEIAWARIHKPADVLTVGQQIDAKVLKVDPEKKRISLGMKQLLKDPWDSVAAKYKLGERARGTVTRVLEFGAFVELEPGIEGLIHVSEMSWAKKVRIASDVVKPGESVEVVVLGVNQAEHRISLGLKQALGDPWANVAESFAPGTVIEGPITSLTKFGAFVQLGEGIEGMIHVSDISAEKRIEFPQDVLKVGQLVKAQVLSVDTTKRLLRLGMKQLVPTSLDEYIAEHKEGDVVTGRMGEVSGGQARVELGDGINAICRIAAATQAKEQSDTGAPDASKPDLSSLSSKLKAHWKGGATTVDSKPEAVRSGQIRKFRIVKLDPGMKKIDLELA
jgi:small subunit ribosomal protein S1